MQDVVTFLKNNPVHFLATVSLDGKARCRPFQCAGELDGKLWFCTNNTKEVFRELQKNPFVQVSATSPDFAWLRMSGEAVFENNLAAKEMCLQSPLVKSIYGDATNPIFVVFYLKNVHAEIADFSGNPAKVYDF